MINSYSRPLRVFLCHSSGDKPVVRELYQKLNTEGWIDVWLDEEKLFPGMDWNLEVEKAVETADVIIVCLSSNSVTKEGYVQRELRFVLDIALEKPEGTIFVIPLRLDNCEPPRRLRGWQYADYFPENLRTRAYQRVLGSLKARAKHLSLSYDESQFPPILHDTSPSLVTPQISQPSISDSSVSPKSTVVAAKQDGGTTKDIWKYGRMMVMLLLILGFFGPWVAGQNGAQMISSEIEYWLFIQSVPRFAILEPMGYLVGAALLLVTLVRLLPSRFRADTAIVGLERLVAGTLALSTLVWMNLVRTLVRDPFLSWGFGLWMIGIYLAVINILFESRFTLQKGQKLQWWAWLLMISIILPWVVSLLDWIYEAMLIWSENLSAP